VQHPVVLAEVAIGARVLDIVFPIGQLIRCSLDREPWDGVQGLEGPFLVLQVPKILSSRL
jgi:hypothetical protein